MAESIFDNKQHLPERSDLEQALGETIKFWDEIRDYLLKKYTKLDEQWKFYSKKAGWSYIIKRDKRTILYFMPCENYFKAFFVYGNKAAEAAENAELPENIKESIRNAQPYVEGRLFFVEVREQDVLKSIYQLIKIKEDN